MSYDTIIAKDVELVLTNSEYGFKEVLNSFPKSSQITIITYSIHDDLLSLLYELDESTEVTIVTNIPPRFETYKSNSQKSKAKILINLYKNLINSSKFNPFTTTFFNFNNHSKIILSDSVAYIGSQNYYGLSSWECGTLIRSESTINQIKYRFIDKILENSIPYSCTDIPMFMEPLCDSVYGLIFRLEDELFIALCQYYDCGIDADSICLSWDDLLEFVEDFKIIYSYLLKYELDVEIKRSLTTLTSKSYKLLTESLSQRLQEKYTIQCSNENIFLPIYSLILENADLYSLTLPIEGIYSLSDTLNYLNDRLYNYNFSNNIFKKFRDTFPIDNTID